MKLTAEEITLVVKALEKQIEDDEVLLLDMGDNEFIRMRAFNRIMKVEKLIKKIENVS